MNQRQTLTSNRTYLFSLITLLTSLFTAGSMFAITVSDPASLPFAYSFGLGADFEYVLREMDVEEANDRDFNSSRIMGNVSYAIHDQVAFYVKAGLMQCETLSNDNADWGFGMGIGVKGYPFEFQNGDIRIGIDAQLLRAETDFTSVNRAEEFTYDENITWLEYQLTGVFSWRAYMPLTLYTGIQLSGVKLKFDTEKYYFSSSNVFRETIDADQDQMLALLWGVEYQIYDQAQLFAELRAMSEITGAFGFRFTF